MKIFLSYSHQDKDVADDVNLALSSHYSVFFDKDDLPKAQDFNTRIRKAIEDIPSYLKAVNWIKTDGNIPATVVNEVIKIESVTNFDVNKPTNKNINHPQVEKIALSRYLSLGLASIAILLSIWQVFQSDKYLKNTDKFMSEDSEEIVKIEEITKNFDWALNHAAAAAACVAISPVNYSKRAHVMIPREFQKSCKDSCRLETKRVYTECLASIAIGGIVKERASEDGQVLAAYYKYDCNQTDNGNDEAKTKTVAYNAYCCCHVPIVKK